MFVGLCASAIVSVSTAPHCNGSTPLAYLAGDVHRASCVVVARPGINVSASCRTKTIGRIFEDLKIPEIAHLICRTLRASAELVWCQKTSRETSVFKRGTTTRGGLVANQAREVFPMDGQEPRRERRKVSRMKKVSRRAEPGQQCTGQKREQKTGNSTPP